MSLDCLFLIVPSVFCYLYIGKISISIAYVIYILNANMLMIFSRKTDKRKKCNCLFSAGDRQTHILYSVILDHSSQVSYYFQSSCRAHNAKLAEPANKAQTDYLINMAHITGKGKTYIDITHPYGLCVSK
jgi:hypothetical protein